MSSLKITNAYLYDSETRTFRRGEARAEDGVFSHICFDGTAQQADETLDCNGKRVIPGLVDIHTHGRVGYDFTAATAEQMKKMKADYASLGVTTVVPTLASATFEEWLSATEAVKTAGFDAIHYEGRYLAPSKRGAHNASLLCLPDIDELKTLVAAASPMAVRITIAPELDGATEFITEAVKLGVRISIGHTAATYEQATAALAAGADCFTHTYNAMSALTHREPGCVGAALTSGAYAECICDGFHLHSAAVKLLYLAKGTARTVLITDSMMAAGLSDGEYSIGGLPVTVSGGHAVTHEGAIAGSTLDLWTGLRNFMSFTGLTLEQALPCATSVPAETAGIARMCGSLRQGLRARACVLSEDGQTVETVINQD